MLIGGAIFVASASFGVGTAKSAPEIRDRSQTARIHASMILAVVFYRYDASHQWLPAAAISGAVG